MKHEHLLPVLLFCAALSGQTRVDLQSQSKNVDFTSATSVRPFRTGTALPPVCLTGEMFFKTNAPAGSNSYGCVAPNTWTLQGSGSGGSVAATVPLQVALTSNTTLSVGAQCSVANPCRVRIGAIVYNFATPATATVTSGNGAAYVYVSRDGNLIVGTSAVGSPAVICSACQVLGGVTQFPSDSIPLAVWNATSGTWDPAGTDTRTLFSGGPSFTAGPNVTITETGSNVTIAAASGSASAGGSATELQYRNNGGFAAVPASSVSGGAVRLAGTIPASDALLGLGSTPVGGSAAGTVFGINAPSGFSGDLANWMVNGLSRVRVDSSGQIFLSESGMINAGLLKLVGDGFETNIWGNYSASPNSSLRIGIYGTDASTQIRLGVGLNNAFVLNGFGKIALGTTAPAPSNAATGPDLQIQDATAAGNTQMQVLAGTGQNRDLMQWASSSGVAGARVTLEGALQNLPFGTKPTCSQNRRGMLWHTAGGAGVKDDVHVCAKDSADAYAWRILY